MYFLHSLGEDPRLTDTPIASPLSKQLNLYLLSPYTSLIN
jgi:hypothetical protein